MDTNADDIALSEHGVDSPLATRHASFAAATANVSAGVRDQLMDARAQQSHSSGHEIPGSRKRSDTDEGEASTDTANDGDEGAGGNVEGENGDTTDTHAVDGSGIDLHPAKAKLGQLLHERGVTTEHLRHARTAQMGCKAHATPRPSVDARQVLHPLPGGVPRLAFAVGTEQHTPLHVRVLAGHQLQQPWVARIVRTTESETPKLNLCLFRRHDAWNVCP